MIPQIEILPPKQNSEKLDADLEQFADKFNRVMEAGYGVCITDNAMGKRSFQATELITELGLEYPDPELVHVHLNTFHTKENLLEILDTCVARGFKNILVISGDGSELLPKLQPEDLADLMDVTGVQSVTSVTLIKYIKARHPGFFNIAAAFNPYEPEDHEFEKLARKIEAGAEMIITQPIIPKAYAALDKMLAKYPDVSVVLECWMSKKLHLLSDAVGYTIPEDTPYDPFECLAELQKNYPKCGIYLALVGFKTQWDTIKTLFPV